MSERQERIIWLRRDEKEKVVYLKQDETKKVCFKVFRVGTVEATFTREGRNVQVTFLRYVHDMISQTDAIQVLGHPLEKNQKAEREGVRYEGKAANWVLVKNPKYQVRRLFLEQSIDYKGVTFHVVPDTEPQLEEKLRRLRGGNNWW